MKQLLLSFCSFLVIQLSAQQQRIGVLRDYTIKRIVFAYDNGSFSVFGDTSEYGTILPNEFVDLEWLSSGKISVKIGVTEVAQVSKVNLVTTKLNTSIVYSPKSSTAKERKYKDDVEVLATESGLTIVNLVDMQNYLGGVVESEGGGGRDLEYYKVQATISRTYALKTKGRHSKEGFDLCDRTHCQAYHYQLRYTPVIDSAVRQTKGKVLVDQHNHLIDAYFHANCGGQTSEPDYVWNNKVDYLKSFKDTFCIYTKQATWEKRIPQQDWKNYLEETFQFPSSDSIFGPLICTFNQPDRCAFYISPVLGIPLRDIRDHFKLKSTYFNCYPDGTDVLIRGRGYGHGVGLCQEGAMKMAKYKFNYQQIIVYYFPGAKLIDVSDLDREVVDKEIKF